MQTKPMETLQITLAKTVSVGLETNGKGYLGYIVELPGAYIRGATEAEALSKVGREGSSYLRWLSIQSPMEPNPVIVQRHQTSLMVEDADTEILLDADKGPVAEAEINWLVHLALRSAETFLKIYSSSQSKDWIEETHNRKTFYGNTPRTLREVFGHVNRVQYYYLSRARVHSFSEQDFMRVRQLCLNKITELWRKNDNLVKYEVSDELWTLKKILRRFIWHDRIHGKCMMRMLEKQQQLGLIGGYEDPFCFGLSPAAQG